MSAQSYMEIVRRMPDDVRASWEARAFAACHLPNRPLAGLALPMILCAALGLNHHKGQVRAMYFGDNARIDAKRIVWTRLTKLGVDFPEIPICTVDELNGAINWLLEHMGPATEKEYVEVKNKINAWIARDETQMDLHVEKMRTTLPGG